jgi:hypothetical protein
VCAGCGAWVRLISRIRFVMSRCSLWIAHQRHESDRDQSDHGREHVRSMAAYGTSRSYRSAILCRLLKEERKLFDPLPMTNSWPQIMVPSVTGALRKIHFDIERSSRSNSATLR